MPSIPQSLLWISLVVLWLFVLVPMLVSKRENVRRTSDVALATRVLNRNGRLLRKRGPATGHSSDPHWRHAVDEDDDFEGDDAMTAPRKTVVLAESALATEPDYLDVDVVEDSGALPVGVARAEQAELPLDLGIDPEDGFEEEFEEAIDDWEREADRPKPASRTAQEDPSTAAIRTVAEADFEPEESSQESDDADESDESDDEDTGEVQTAGPDGTEHDYEYVDDSSGLEAPVAETPSEARRNRYESKTAAAVSARKYRFRKNVLLGMGVALLLTAVAAFFLTPTMWWATGAVGAITLLYLGYLRRQTRIEEQLRRRRAQRMARSRLGVENTDDREFDVVPSRLRRPGSVVLEIDDEDPIFEHLEYATYAEYDLPQAAGQ